MDIMSLFMTVLTSSISKAARYQKMTVTLLSYTGETTRILQLARNLKLRHASTLSVGYICGLFFFELGGCLMIKMTLGQLTFNAIFDDRYESRLYQYYL